MSAPSPAAIELKPGLEVAGRYTLIAPLGRGAGGTVWEARHTPSGRSVALKIVVPEAGAAEDLVARLRREARAAALLDHPNIVEVLDLGAVGADAIYLAMELIHGEPLAAILERGPLPTRRALLLARQTLEALAHVHTHGMIHRDLKPANVMIVRVGEPGQTWEQVKLVDFGLVKLIGATLADLGGERLTRTGFTFGTPAYMAPEQAMGQSIDARADLYALGVMLFEMLTGTRLFDFKDTHTVLAHHIATPPPTLAERAPGAAWATPALEALLAGALRKAPAERFADAGAMLVALDAGFVSIDHLP